MNNLNECLLLFGSPSIIIVLGVVVVYTWDSVRTSNQHWSAKNYNPVVK